MLYLLILFYFILFYFILFYFILFYFILFYFILFYFIFYFFDCFDHVLRSFNFYTGYQKINNNALVEMQFFFLEYFWD